MDTDQTSSGDDLQSGDEGRAVLDEVGTEDEVDEAEADEIDADADDDSGADDVDDVDEILEEDIEDEALGLVADADTAAGIDGAVAAAEIEAVAIDAEELLEEQAEPPVEEDISPYDRPGRWYVVHTQSGYENKVKQNLEARTSSMNMEERIFEVVIPTEDVVEFKGGRKVVVQRKVFPGYLLVRVKLDDDSWFVIRQTPGVTGFVGAGNKPSPLPRRDVETFLQVKPTGEQPKRGKPKLEYEMGETVRVKEGPFADFSGEIVELNEDQLKVKVLVNIFGRETPVELEFSQIARL